jgi:DNA-binding NarL/FixJ family response regulator
MFTGTATAAMLPICATGQAMAAMTSSTAGQRFPNFAEASAMRAGDSQASLVIDHIGLADVIARQQQAGQLEGLSAREREVLELMSRGLSNAVICKELHLSIKTVEPVVSTIFTKLGVHAHAGSNRRVLAVLAFLRT